MNAISTRIVKAYVRICIEQLSHTNSAVFDYAVFFDAPMTIQFFGTQSRVEWPIEFTIIPRVCN